MSNVIDIYKKKKLYDKFYVECYEGTYRIVDKETYYNDDFCISHFFKINYIKYKEMAERHNGTKDPYNEYSINFNSEEDANNFLMELGGLMY